MRHILEFHLRREMEGNVGIRRGRKGLFSKISFLTFGMIGRERKIKE